MAGPVSSSSSFFRELKRRKVVRTCVLYILSCWGILQVGDILFPAMGLDSDVASRNALYLAVLGFPLTFAIAWFFQVSSSGIVRTTSFVERRVLSNISPINERRHGGMNKYFRKEDAHPDFKWILSAETGPLAGLSFGVSGPLTLGRALDCDVAMVSQHVSRQHARLDTAGDELTVEDLDSSNGTVVNGKKVKGIHSLRHEDELRFHDIVFRVTQGYSGLRDERGAMNTTTVIDATEMDLNTEAEDP